MKTIHRLLALAIAVMNLTTVNGFASSAPKSEGAWLVTKKQCVTRERSSELALEPKEFLRIGGGHWVHGYQTHLDEHKECQAMHVYSMTLIQQDARPSGTTEDYSLILLTSVNLCGDLITRKEISRTQAPYQPNLHSGKISITPHQMAKAQLHSNHCPDGELHLELRAR